MYVSDFCILLRISGHHCVLIMLSIQAPNFSLQPPRASGILGGYGVIMVPPGPAPMLYASIYIHMLQYLAVGRGSRTRSEPRAADSAHSAKLACYNTRIGYRGIMRADLYGVQSEYSHNLFLFEPIQESLNFCKGSEWYLHTGPFSSNDRRLTLTVQR